MLDPTKKETPCPRAKEKPQQDCRRGKIAFRIKPHTHQRYLEGSNKTLCTPGGPLETEPDLPGWEGLKAGGEGDNRGWDGWLASLTRWTWVWAGSGSWWWTGKPGVLQSTGLQRVGHNWVTELNWTSLYFLYYSCLRQACWKVSRTGLPGFEALLYYWLAVIVGKSLDLSKLQLLLMRRKIFTSKNHHGDFNEII